MFLTRVQLDLCQQLFHAQSDQTSSSAPLNQYNLNLHFCVAEKKYSQENSIFFRLSVLVGICPSVSLLWKITDLDKWNQA